MDRKKQKALEVAGFRHGDVEDFLELTGEERSIVALRVAAARTVRRFREKLHLSQQDLASKIQSSQSRVAKIEAAARGVSLHLSFRGLFAVGGKIADLAASAGERGPATRRQRRPFPKTPSVGRLQRP